MQFEFRPDREAHLRMLCTEMGRSVDDFINEAVLTFMEDYEDGRDAEEAMRAIRQGEKTYTLEEVMKEYGLDDHDLAGSAQADDATRSDGSQESSSISARKTSQAA